MKILTIGNSFSDNATLFLKRMADNQNIEMVLGKTNIGGCSLEKHWNLVEQCDLLPDIKPYNFFFTGAEVRTISLKEALVCEKWDYVTLQQVSHESWRKETYSPYIEKLFDFVRSIAPQAEAVIHQTWAYRSDAIEYKQYRINQEDMFKSLKETYAEIAQKLGLRIIPSGEAFQKVRAVLKYSKDTDFNYENPLPLELPEQKNSIISGYYWRTGNTASGKAELHLDGRHGNDKGCYLANAVWFETLLGKSIYDNNFCPEGLLPEDLGVLKAAAHQAAVEYGWK